MAQHVDHIDSIPEEDIERADTVLVVYPDGEWQYTTKSHSNDEIGDALIRIGFAIKVQEGTL